MPYTLPPPPLKKQKVGTWQQFINKHPALKKWAPLITQMAERWGIDRFQLASIIVWESGGNPSAVGDNGTSFGFGQINTARFGEATPFGVVSRENALNPTFNIQYIAYSMSNWMADNGADLKGFYTKSWNPGYSKERGPWSVVPKGAVPQAGGGIPGSAERGAVTKNFTDPYAMLKNGRIVGTGDPRKALKSFGLPVRVSQFQQYWSQLSDDYESYLGRKATAAEAAQVLRNGWSEYKLQTNLVKSPEFLKAAKAGKSPVWNSRAPNYKAVAEKVMGGQVDDSLIAEAIVNNWDDASFAYQLRHKPEYVNSKGFKQEVAPYEGMFRRVYGAPTDADRQLINQVALEEWTGDQWSSWLRSQDAYKYSPEGVSRAVSFLGELGLIFGAEPTLKAQGPEAAPLQVGTKTAAAPPARQAGYG
jgi:hypothetical protein